MGLRQSRIGLVDAVEQSGHAIVAWMHRDSGDRGGAQTVAQHGGGAPGLAPVVGGVVPASATTRRSMVTNRPDSGRFDQVVSAVTWTRTTMPSPRFAAVTIGVPS